MGGSRVRYDDTTLIRPSGTFSRKREKDNLAPLPLAGEGGPERSEGPGEGMTFLKDFVNVLSEASISFVLLSAIFIFIVYFNLLGGRLKSKAGYGFLGFGILLIVAGIFILPLLYLGIAYLILLFGLASLGPRLWDRKIGLRLFILGAIAFAVSMLDPNLFLIAAKGDNVPIVAMLFLVGFFLWLSMHQAITNDGRIAQGLKPMEASDGEADNRHIVGLGDDEAKVRVEHPEDEKDREKSQQAVPDAV